MEEACLRYSGDIGIAKASSWSALLLVSAFMTMGMPMQESVSRGIFCDGLAQRFITNLTSVNFVSSLHAMPARQMCVYQRGLPIEKICPKEQ